MEIEIKSVLLYPSLRILPLQKIGAETPSWPELLGSKHWSGLLDPLDHSLRVFLLQCGDMCEVTGDSFIGNDDSKYRGMCRYRPSTLLYQVFFPYAANYDVKEYLYAMSHDSKKQSKESNWMGYIAVSKDAYTKLTGRREIYVVWRGTGRPPEWIEDITVSLVPLDPDNQDVQVMQGWNDIYTLKDSDPQFPCNATSAREQLLSKLSELVELYKNESLSIVCVGYSLGGALAILSSFDIVNKGLSKIEGKAEYFPVCAMVFENPKVGNKAFNDRFEELPKLRALRVRNDGDIVPYWPFSFDYVDTGSVLDIAAKKSPCLKPLVNNHDLQVVLHAVAGWNGKDADFHLEVKRSPALVNKAGGYLKDELHIPKEWWVEKNKGMVLNKGGEWSETPGWNCKSSSNGHQL
ncbi:phosphatidylcholine 1-acylhydrolase [Musa troglodytarum]|uniref:Phospholipase A1 n=1 Tax=Musa troglodytarum TaxID=320322 RepID=A0A9E7EBJ0_9LILI|nr:phosphatidylcholine 1-acylhydrolase [Musa troglodytarum]